MSDTKKKIRTKRGSASLEALLCLCTAPCKGDMRLRRRTGRTRVARFENAATIEYGAVFTRLRCISLPFINIEFMLISVFQGIGGAKQAFVLSFFRKGIFDLPLMMLANMLWPMYGLMLVEPVMEFLGGSLAVFLYRRQNLADQRAA